MTFVALHTGQVIDLAQIGVPGLPRLHAFDLALPLSRINRFNGHTSRLYSVAEHSLHVVTIMERDLTVRDSGQLLAGLLHDAHEAIIGDVTTPVKQRCACCPSPASTPGDRLSGRCRCSCWTSGAHWMTTCWPGR